MNKKGSVSTFDDDRIHSVLDDSGGRHPYSVVDTIAGLTENNIPMNYRTVLKLRAADGKIRETLMKWIERPYNEGAD